MQKTLTAQKVKRKSSLAKDKVKLAQTKIEDLKKN
jgi:hypothetical protein